MAAPAPAPAAARPSCVQISGLSLLQIVKHCQEAMPAIASGVVLGMEQRGVLEVTHSFPTPNAQRKRRNDEVDDVDDDGGVAASGSGETVDVNAYTVSMLKQLREVNVDNNNMGWYRSSQGLGGFLDKAFVDDMVAYYRENPNSFVLVFDPWFSRKGSLLLKAFRLRPAFYKVYQTQTFSQATFDALGQSTVLEEVPIRVSNSPLARVFLWDLGAQLGDAIDCDFERLNLAANDSLEKQLGFMSSCVEDLVEDQDKIRYQQRKNRAKKRDLARKRAEQEARQRANVGSAEIAVEDNIKAPNRLQSLLVSSRINNYCQQINAFTDDSFTRLFLASSVQKE